MEPKNREQYVDLLTRMRQSKSEGGLTTIANWLRRDPKFEQNDILLAETTVRHERGWARKC